MSGEKLLGGCWRASKSLTNSLWWCGPATCLATCFPYCYRCSSCCCCCRRAVLPAKRTTASSNIRPDHLPQMPSSKSLIAALTDQHTTKVSIGKLGSCVLPSRRLLKMSSSTEQLASPSNPGAYFIENGCTRVPGSFEGGPTTLLHWCKWSVMLRESVQSSGRETWTLVREPVQYIYIYRFCVVARAGSIQQQQQQEVVPS